MASKALVRRTMFAACLRLTPPIVRSALLADDALAEKFGIEREISVTFGATGIAFPQQKLHSAVKVAIKKPGKSVNLVDQAGVQWLVVASLDKKRPGISIKSGDKSMQVGHLLLLGSNREARLFVIDAETKRLSLPISVASRWRALANKKALTSDELDDLVKEFSEGPIAVAERIQEQLDVLNVTLDILVPRSPSYYERLVGCVAGQKDFQEYLDQVGTSHIDGLLKSTDGIKLALLLGSHPLVSQKLRAYKFEPDEMAETLKWASNADIASKCTLVETLWPVATKRGRGAGAFKSLVKGFAGVGQKDKYDPYGVFSAAFICSYGELAQSRALAAKPAYWRRLAALAHAGIITRAVLLCSLDLSKFIDWMRTARSRPYVFQIYADLRTEPRWLAEWGASGQLRNEFGGRILLLAAGDEGRAKQLDVYDVLLGDVKPSLKLQLDLLRTKMPGPLEGNIEAQTPIPEEILAQIRESLTSPMPDLSSFAALVNVTNLLHMPSDLPELAADALRRAQYRLDGDAQYLHGILIGLAVLAASKRNMRLADELFVVIRNYRRFLKDQLDLDTAFRVGIIACASREDLVEWSKCVGALVSDLAFGEMTREEAGALHPVVIGLCDIVPELWSACSQGLAALEGVAVS